MLQRVAAIAAPGVSPFEFGLVSEVFGIDRSDTGGPTFDLVVCTPEPGDIPMKTGLTVRIDADLEATADADLVVALPYGDDYALPEPMLAALRDARARGAWVMSICSGAFALAQAGLLDGRRCTTHWLYAADLAARFPAARVDPAVLYVEDDGVITSAGTAAGIDACLHLVRAERGAQAAAGVARRMVVPPHRDGNQLQFVDTPLPCEADTLAPLLGWMTEHLADELSVPELAARALMSERTFARRFRAETGTTPAAWLTRQRLVRAQELLERTGAGVDEIARSCGFGTAAVLRHHFARVLDTTPQAYRRQFACTDEAVRVA
ncbi:helix-turn-helix domain-containing protein [Cellulomonas denverensis]|uniref:helix-turn-helix domain-containing protein n=1 Tax=Cellulomonas denverensis TaxID=264297 RepID=UPI0035E6369B